METKDEYRPQGSELINRVGKFGTIGPGFRPDLVGTRVECLKAGGTIQDWGLTVFDEEEMETYKIMDGSVITWE